MEDRQREHRQASRLVSIEVEGVTFGVDPQSGALSEIDDTEIGKVLGEMIVKLVDLIAEVDGITRDDVLEALFSEWWQQRIIDEAAGR